MSDRWLYAWGLAAAAAFAGVPGALGVGWLADRTGHRRRYILAAIGVVAASLAVFPSRRRYRSSSR